MFAEYVPGTRFNLRYIRSLSDIVGKLETFKIEKTTIANPSLAGGETQAIKSQPMDRAEPEGWRRKSVQTTSGATSSTATMGAANCFGFQLYKKDGPGDNRRAISRNWSCVYSPTWIVPDNWYVIVHQPMTPRAPTPVPETIGHQENRPYALMEMDFGDEHERYGPPPIEMDLGF